MSAVKAREMTLVQAAAALEVSYRQARRIWARYQKAGEAGLVHRSRGRAGSRRIDPAQRQRVLRRFQERYLDFGPTLAAEYLLKDGWRVDHETLRRWLIQEGLWAPGRARQKHRQWRERKACFGQMAQLDGSHHDWFEGRRAEAVLMVMVDDASNHTQALFSEEETTRAAYDLFAEWTARHGLPSGVYADRDSIYRCERPATVAEEVAGQKPLTQFGRAMQALGVELKLAYSPQAKGRVERRNGVLQDRLIKALRLEGISDLASANTYLQKRFLPEFNRRFQVQPASPANVHRPAPPRWREALSWEEPRVVRKDWTVGWAGRWFQIDRAHQNLSLAGRAITVRLLREGQLQLLHRGQKLKWKELPARPPAMNAPARAAQAAANPPGPQHPWKIAAAAGQRRRQQIQAAGGGA